MKSSRSATSQEPIGIVISPGAPQEIAPARFAYIWAPPPDEKSEGTAAADGSARG